MKKILLALLTLISIISYSQTTGYLRYDSVRIMKQGGNSNLIIENATRDSLGFLYNYGNGRTRFEVIRAVPGGIKVGEDTIIVSNAQGDFLIGGSVTPEGGFRFSVQEATYAIEGTIYNSDSATVFVDSADATFDRFDVIYLDSDEVVKVLKGIPAENPAIPQLPSGTRLLTVVSIEAGAIQANVTTINVYFENDATITPSGTTAVGNSTTAPYAGTYHIRITTNNNGDFVDIIKPSGTWDISGQDFLSFHIKNLAQVPQLANWRASLWNGASTGSQVSGEVTLNYNKNNATTYQAISIPMAAFGSITNTNIDRIRLRYTSNNATNHAGIDLDNIFFGDNLQQPVNGGTGQFTLNVPSFLTLTPTNTIVTNNTTYTLAANGTSAQYVRGDGSLATFSAVTTVGAFGSQASQANGLFISGVNIYGQPVTATEPGMTTPAMKASWDSSYYVQNLGDGLEIARAVDGATTGLRSLVFIGADTSASNDSVIVADFSGSGGGFFTSSTASGTVTQNLGGEEFVFRGTGQGLLEIGTSNLGIGGDDVQYLSFFGGGGSQMKIGGDYLIGSAYTEYNVTGSIIQHSDMGFYQFDDLPDSAAAGTHHMVVWNATNDRLYKMDLPDGSGGGSSGLFPTTGTGTATGAVIGDLDGNSLDIIGGNVGIGQSPTGLFTVGNGTSQFVLIDPANFDLFLSATDATAESFFALRSESGNDMYVDMAARDGLGVEVRLKLDAQTNNITYTAGQHTLVGAVRLNALAGNGAGVVAVDNDGDLSWLATPGGALNLSYDATNHEVDISGGGTSSVVPLSLADGATEGLASFSATYFDATSGNITPDLTNGLASGSQGGWLSSADWTTFNGKQGALTNSAGLLAALSDETGTGLAVFGTSPTLTTPTLSGLVTTAATTLQVATASGTGFTPSTMFARSTSDFTLANSSSDQTAFGSTIDTWTLQGSTTYFFEGSYDITTGAVSHSTAMGFALAGGASITSIKYNTLVWTATINGQSPSQNTTEINQTATTVVNAAGAVVTQYIKFSGWISVNAGGTFTPQIKFSADPTGTCLMKAGSYIRFTPVGTNTIESLGNVN